MYAPEEFVSIGQHPLTPPQIIFNDGTGVDPRKDSEFQQFTFSCSYVDLDNDYPEFVYLEIGGKNYSMINLYGDWDARTQVNDNGILFIKSLVLEGMSNRSFRFHVSDGNETIKSQWYNRDNSLIGIIKKPTPYEFKLTKNKKAIGFEFSNDDPDDYYVVGNVEKKENTEWLRGDNTWHFAMDGGQEIIYGGRGQSYKGNYQGKQSFIT